MKILYIVEKMSDKGGMERIIADKMNYLAEHTAHQIVLMLLWHDPKPYAYPLSRKIRVIHLNVPYGIKVLALYRFKKIIRKVQPDLTIYTWVMGALLAAHGGWQGPSIYEAHRARPTMKHQWLQDAMEKKVDAVVTLTEQDSSKYTRAKRVEVIPNFTSLSPATNADYNARNCIAIGRLIDAKDFTRLIRIWKQVTDSCPDWHLDIVGDGPQEPVLKQQINDLGLNKSITLHPSTDDILPFYCNSSIYLMTSKYEGLGMVLIEAMTCGLPIISFDCDYGPRHLIKNDVNGWLINCGSDSDMVRAICELMNNPDRRIEMGQNSLSMSEKYRPSVIMNRWLQLFHNITNRIHD